MFYSICFIVALTSAFIPCDAQFGGFGGNFGWKNRESNKGLGGFDEMGMGGLEGEEMGGLEGMGGGMKIVGKWSPLIPTAEEVEMCKDEAESKGQDFMAAYKVPKQTCKTRCQMKDGEVSVLNSPKDTLCCDIGGLAPTGECNNDGKCIVFMM